MISSTGNTRETESPKPHTEESEDRARNMANRQRAAIEADRAVEGLNLLRLQKRREKNPNLDRVL
jgi:hypothetical protein